MNKNEFLKEVNDKLTDQLGYKPKITINVGNISFWDLEYHFMREGEELYTEWFDQ